jgi:hypothetical protein
MEGRHIIINDGTDSARWVRIDRDVPVPVAEKRIKPDTQQIYERMLKGESVLFKNRSDADRLRNYIKYKRGAGSACWRKIPGEGWRVWLLK